MVQRVSDGGIGIAASPREDGRAIDDDSAPADEARVPGEVDQHDEEQFVQRRTHPLAPLALLGWAGHTYVPPRVAGQPAGQRERRPVHQPVMHILLG